MTGRIQLDFTISRQLKTIVPANEIWDLLQETGRIGDEFSPGPIVQVAGTISFLFDGEELLGPNYWTDLYNLIHLAPLGADETRPIIEQLSNSGLRGHMQFQRRDDGAIEYSLTFNKEVLKTVSIPAQPLIDAWTYLWFRIRRLEAELGDGPAISATKHRHEYFPKGYFDHVDQSLIEFALQAPLKEVLASPRSFG